MSWKCVDFVGMLCLQSYSQEPLYSSHSVTPSVFIVALLIHDLHACFLRLFLFLVVQQKSVA